MSDFLSDVNVRVGEKKIRHLHSIKEGEEVKKKLHFNSTLPFLFNIKIQAFVVLIHFSSRYFFLLFLLFMQPYKEEVKKKEE